MSLPPYPAPPVQTGVCAEIAPHAEMIDEVRIGMAILGIIWTIIDVLAPLLFMFAKKGYLRLQERSTYMVWYVAIGDLFLIYITSVRDVYGRDWFPCMTIAWMNAMVFLFIGGPVVANLYVYAFKLRRERTIVRNAMAFQGKLNQRTMKQLRHFGLEKMTFFAKARDFFSVWRLNQATEEPESHSALHPEVPEKDTVTLEGGGSILPKRSAVNTASSGRSKYGWLKKILGPRFFVDCVLPTFFCIIVGIPFIIISLIRVETDPLYRNNCLGCDRSYIDYVCIIVGMVLIGLAIVVALYATWNEPDPMGIKFEAMLCTVVTGNFTVISWALTFSDPNNLDKRGLFSWQGTQSFPSGLLLIMMSYVQVGVAIYQRRVIIGNKKFYFDIDAILDDEGARNALLKHCTNELSSENVLFLIEVRMWVKDWEVEEAGRLVDRAKAIYESYVSDRSEMTINISHLVRLGVSKAIGEMNHEKKPDRDLFEYAVQECEQILLHDSLPRFHRTKIFELEIVKTGLIDKITKMPSARDSKGVSLGRIISFLPAAKSAAPIAQVGPATPPPSQPNASTLPRPSFDAV